MSPLAASTGGARQAHGSLRLQGTVWGHQRGWTVGTQKAAGCREGERPAGDGGFIRIVTGALGEF